MPNELTVIPQQQVSPFSSVEAFEASQRMALAMCTASLLPEGFRGKENIGNILIVMDLARSIGVTVFTVAVNMDLIHGRPCPKATFVIGCVNSSGKFSPLQYRWQGTEGKDDWGARGYAKRLSTGEECIGPLVTLGMAKAEGWYQKNGSKWKTMPEVMIGYRAATFWARLFCPEIMQGIPQTADEVRDIGEVKVTGTAKSVDEMLNRPAAAISGSVQELTPQQTELLEFVTGLGKGIDDLKFAVESTGCMVWKEWPSFGDIPNGTCEALLKFKDGLKVAMEGETK